MHALLFAVVAGLCWGIGEVCAKAVLHTHKVGPFFAVALRSSIALPVIWGAYLVAHRLAPSGAGRGLSLRGEAALNAREWALLVGGSGVIAGAMAMIAFYIAISLGEVSRMKPVAFTIAPATAVVLGMLLLGESVSMRKIAGVVVVLMGVLLIASGSNTPAT